MQEDDFPEDASRPSKTKQKEAMHELRDLGAELVELPVSQLKRLDLPENLLIAVRECQKITAHGARRRQRRAVPLRHRQADAGDGEEERAFHRRNRGLRRLF